jgi:membrane-associated phospholipid phosphatase
MELLALAILLIVFISLIVSIFLVVAKGSAVRTWFEAKANWKWVALLILSTASEMALNRLFPLLGLRTRSSETLSNFLGTVPGSLQHALGSPELTLFTSLVYIIGLPVVLVVVPLLILDREERYTLRRYCLAMFIAYAGLFILHVTIPTTRPSLEPGTGIAPLLYSDPFFSSLVSSVGSHDSSLPSGHTTLLGTCALVLWTSPRLRAWSLGVAVLLAMTVFSVIYLGVHWPLDVVAGLGLAAFAVIVSSRLVRIIEKEGFR